MSKHRKFNSEQFLRGFEGHEHELHELFLAHGVAAPDVLEVKSFYATLTRRPSGEVETLLGCMHELNDLSGRQGREILEQACKSVTPQVALDEDMCNARAACHVYLHHHEAFEHAMELMAVRAIQSANVAIFPGREAAPIADGEAVKDAMGRQLRSTLRIAKSTDAVEVRHYVDGDALVFIVFCERTAEVQLEFGANKQQVMSRVRRPADQHVLVYYPATGCLEIEGARHKERAILREAFAKAAFDDEDFFPASENSQLLNLDHLLQSHFNLPTSLGHTARITGLELVGQVGGRKFVWDLAAGRTDVVAVLQQREMLLGATIGASVHSVRIELTLDATRAGRKSIILKGSNSIQFNRTSYAGVVYAYLTHWGLMRHGVATPHLV